jgi:hypothetical protein
MRARLSDPHRLSVGALSVPAIASTAYRTAHAVALKQVLEVTTAILAATVTVEDQARLRKAAKPRHTQRIRHQLRAHVRLHRPAHHLTAEQVENDGQIQPTLVRPDVRDVRSPDLVGTRGREVSLQQVRCDRQPVVAIGRDLEPAFGLRLDAVQLHEPLDTILADTNALGQQLLPHARPAVLAFGFSVHGLDVHQQSVVADASARSVSINIPRLARVVTAGADTQHLAGKGHRLLSAVKLDPGVYMDSPGFANNASSLDARCQSARIYAACLCGVTAGHNANRVPRSHYFSGLLWPLCLSDFRGWVRPIASSIVHRSQTAGGCTAEILWIHALAKRSLLASNAHAMRASLFASAAAATFTPRLLAS